MRAADILLEALRDARLTREEAQHVIIALELLVAEEVRRALGEQEDTDR